MGETHQQNFDLMLELKAIKKRISDLITQSECAESDYEDTEERLLDLEKTSCKLLKRNKSERARREGIEKRLSDLEKAQRSHRNNWRFWKKITHFILKLKPNVYEGNGGLAATESSATNCS